MHTLNKKLYRDIKFNKSQFITIFLMVFLGVFVFAGIHAYMDGMKISGDTYYEENNFQDIWLMGENFTKEDLDKVKQLENVKDAERQLSVTTTLDGYENVTLETIFIESNNISKMYVVQGEGFNKGKSGIWLDSYLAENLDLEVGQTITLVYQNYKIEEKIVGLVNTPDHIYSVKNENEIFPTHKDFGFVYLSINEFPEQYIYDKLKEEILNKNPMISNETLDIKTIEKMIPDFNIEDYYIFTSIIVDAKDTLKLEETKVELENNIKTAIAITDRNSSASYMGYNSEIEEGKTYSVVFTALFLFIAVLSVITTMHRFVKKERTQIGTLKALGVKKNRIIRHYVSYGFYISFIASVLGVIIGRYTLGEYFLNMITTYFEIQVCDTVILPVVYILAILVVLAVTFITYLSCRKILKEQASEALRVEMPKNRRIRFDITRLKIFKNTGFSTRWNIRDMLRNKGRTIMAIVGIAGCTMLIVCAFGFMDSLNSYLDWEFETICDFEYKLSLKSDYTDEEYKELISKYGTSTSQTLGIEIKNGDIKETNSLTINDGQDKLRYTNHNKEYITLENTGVYITEKLSEKLSLGIGDDITWHIFGDDNWYTTKIVGINRDPQNQQLNMTREFYESLNLTYKADSIYTNEDLKEIKVIEGVETIQDIDSLRLGMENMLGTMKSVVVLLIVVSIILGCVIIYNLGILSFSEKQYQFATLKVLGFKDKQIKRIFIKQNIWITIIAIIIGLPLGYFMIDYVYKSALGESYDFNAYVKIISYLYAVGGTLTVSLVVNKKLAKKIETIDMVTSLKGNE